jgi:molybdate/tungstate transport system substrate-binding protein
MVAENTPVTWYATFATTRLVLAYSPSSKFADAFRKAAEGKIQWYDVLATPGVRIGRTDPVIDPKGYRTIIAMELAERHYQRPLRQAILGDDRNPAQVLSDETILLRLEEGELDAAFLYAIEANIRNLPTISLPKSTDLGDPGLASTYRSASVTVNGVTHIGEPIEYALSVPRNAENPKGAAALIRFLVVGDGRKMLENSGFSVTPLRFYGDRSTVPPEVLNIGH